jgi:hypothetical protein
MPRPAPSSFPAFQEWQNLSESEQDALLDKIETSKRRGTYTMRLLIGAALAGAAALLAAILLGLG